MAETSNGNNAGTGAGTSAGTATGIQKPVGTVTEIALCHVIKGGELLLIKADEGLNKDKWNAPSTEIAKGEQPVKAAMRAVFQQTGLYVNKATFHGTIRLFLNGKTEYSYRLNVFSTKFFTGDLKPVIKGEAKWFGIADVPYYEMWADDKYWTNLVLQGKEFNADFFFDEQNEKITRYQIREKKPIVNVAAVVPILIIALIIGVVAYGVFALNASGAFKTTKGTTSVKTPVLTPSNTPTTVSTTIPATTTVPVANTIYYTTIDNLNVYYNWSGPSEFGNQACNTPTKSQALYMKRTYAGNTKFYLNTTIETAGCNYTITRIWTTTPGFTIDSVSPSIPMDVPPYSTAYFEFQLTTPSQNYTGPLTLQISAN